ncbi:nitroreductase/quinone reductase family protein [Streptomonospora salina]|uniref:Pyridoxamine 5'-phosphate oxidase putative domain-containing protein n=1 Tax=Streptomonospora salina TaxID=104205 RepID=A0A841E637_9ACTN|nr:nitroreductase/quinone reductase family protein [Streptomonospora salina]MBB5996613.1 hypothetical protein [Streptomonospora salina]
MALRDFVVDARGIAPDHLVVLEVAGRSTGRTVATPLVMAVAGGERHLVSMLGDGSNRVRNVRAAGGSAVLRHGRREEVLLAEVAAEHRAQVPMTYLQRAPNAGVHLPVSAGSPLAEFARVAHRFPVFRVTAPPVQALAGEEP